MNVLSIRAPWAELIVSGRKKIELRTWNTKHRGAILIHRSGKDSGIIGIADLADIIQFESLDHFASLRNEHHAPDKFYVKGIYGWMLDNATQIGHVPCKGRLGLWKPPPDVKEKIEALLDKE